MSLNSWSVSVALYFVSVSGHSLSGEFKNECPLIEPGVSVLLEYRRTGRTGQEERNLLLQLERAS